MKNKKNGRIFKCTRPENVDPDLWADCEKCLCAGCGYSRCFEPNPKWEEQNGICMYEHCIENMPLLMPEDARSCPIFGHECPGGVDQVTECIEQVDKVSARVQRRLSLRRSNK